MHRSKCTKVAAKTRKKSVKTKKDIICSQIKPDITSNSSFEEYHPAEGLFEEDQDVEGKEVFQVRNTPKANRKSFIEKFEKGFLLSTPKSKKIKDTEMNSPEFKANRKSFIEKFEKSVQLSTPKSKKIKDAQMNSPEFKGTPETSKKSDERQLRSLRLKMKQELAGLRTATIDSDPEDSDTASDDGDTNSDSGEEVISTVVSDSIKGKKYKGPSFSEAYFAAQKQKKIATSNKTLSNVKLEHTSVQELAEILEAVPENHKKEKEALFKKYCSQFEYWDCLLESGFNILLYGVGSKLKVLKQFCKEFLEDSLYIVLYGFFPSLTLKQILCTITDDALDYNGKFSSIQDHCEFIKNHFSETDEDLYIIIHSIDGMALRSVKTQSILSSLATIPKIHFICSIDHINAALLWDQIMMSHFKWVWFDTTTFEPYVLETSYENTLLRDQSSHLLLSSLLHVYNSLTPNSRGIFLILAKHQKEEQKKNTNTGITFHEWYQECREAFLVNSEITMQAQLSEFKNHKLLTSRKNADGIELWYIPVDTATLEQFLESCE